jgi:hypothetical protein
MSSTTQTRIVSTVAGPVVCEANTEGLVMVRTPEPLNGKGNDPKALEPIDSGGQRYRISLFINPTDSTIIGHESISRVNLDNPWEVNNEPPTPRQRDKIRALAIQAAQEWAEDNPQALIIGRLRGAEHRQSLARTKLADAEQAVQKAQSELDEADAAVAELTDQINNQSEA